MKVKKISSTLACNFGVKLKVGFVKMLVYFI